MISSSSWPVVRSRCQPSRELRAKARRFDLEVVEGTRARLV
jgi:hypothetical protein